MSAEAVKSSIDLCSQGWKEWEAGVICSVNTDDPAYIFDDLNAEYAKVAEAYGYEEEEIIQLVRDSFEHSFAGRQYLVELDCFLATRE